MLGTVCAKGLDTYEQLTRRVFLESNVVQMLPVNAPSGSCVPLQQDPVHILRPHLPASVRLR